MAAGAGSAVDSGLTDREDAFDAGCAIACSPLTSSGAPVALSPPSTTACGRRPPSMPLVDAHQGGAVLGGVSAGATVWGAGTVTEYVTGDPEPLRLFGLIDDVMVFCHYVAGRERSFRERLRAFPGCRGVAVAHGGAVAVDPSRALRPLRTEAAGMAGAVLDEADGELAVL